MWQHNGWNMQLVNDMFLPFEAQQKAQIFVVYNQIDEFCVVGVLSEIIISFLEAKKRGTSVQSICYAAT